MSFNYKTVKEGRSVVAVQFHLNKNKRRQKSLSAAVLKKQMKYLKQGDVVILRGKKYDVMSGGILLSSGAIPMGKLNKMLNEGKIKKV